jgi:hypothetical protein
MALADRSASIVLRILEAAPARFEGLRTKWPKETPTPQRGTLRDILEELDWMGLVRVLNRGDEPDHWIVERAAPSDG